MSDALENQTPALQAKHKTTPIAGSLASVPGYPSKLVIYQLAASKYWWVRYYANGKILRRSTKCEDKKGALSFAKSFYEDLIVRQRQGLAVSKRGSFESCATALIKSQASQLARGEITQITADNTKYRLFKMILSFFHAPVLRLLHTMCWSSFFTSYSPAFPSLSTSLARFRALKCLWSAARLSVVIIGSTALHCAVCHVYLVQSNKSRRK
jgi:hypothetical protein